MTTAEHHRHLATGPRAYMLVAYAGDARLNAQTRLTYRQARWMAEMNRDYTYVVERMAGSKRMDAMAVQA